MSKRLDETEAMKDEQGETAAAEALAATDLGDGDTEAGVRRMIAALSGPENVDWIMDLASIR